ncbi:MAG: DUF4407 domain-containing protein [Brasilonema angustatum HA4187-MV1]|jgi:hypothetical protein|nr:DUF4407 domain-containing protein [Brasilonema angustatum HA4187-MV1]
MKYLFLWCAGCDVNFLKSLNDSDSENAYITEGIAVIVTASFAAFSSGSIFYLVKENWLGAIIFGVFWGIAILLLERGLLMTLPKNPLSWGSFAGTFLGISIRVAFAVCVGYVFAIFFDLIIFQTDIRTTQIAIETSYIKSEKQKIEQLFQNPKSSKNPDKIVKDAMLTQEYWERKGASKELISEARKSVQVANDNATEMRNQIKDKEAHIKFLNGDVTQRDLKGKPFTMPDVLPIGKQIYLLEQIKSSNKVVAAKMEWIPRLFWMLEIVPVSIKVFMPRTLYDAKKRRHKIKNIGEHDRSIDADIVEIENSIKEQQLLRDTTSRIMNDKLKKILLTQLEDIASNFTPTTTSKYHLHVQEKILGYLEYRIKSILDVDDINDVSSVNNQDTHSNNGIKNSKSHK